MRQCKSPVGDLIYSDFASLVVDDEFQRLRDDVRQDIYCCLTNWQSHCSIMFIFAEREQTSLEIWTFDSVNGMEISDENKRFTGSW